MFSKLPIITAADVEKLASRAWKRNFSENSRDRLESSGILNHERERQGLEVGTQNIARKLGTEVKPYSSEDFAKRSMDKFRKNKVTTGMLDAQGINVRNYKNELLSNTASTHKRNGGYVTYSSGHPNEQPMISRGNADDFFKNNYQGLSYDHDIVSGFNSASEGDKAYIDSLLARHEADEARSARLSVRKGLNASVKESTMPTTQLSTGHISPRVTGYESANVATAPKNVKKIMENVRRRSGDSYILSQGKINYGSSGDVNRKGISHLEKMVSRESRPVYKQMLGDAVKFGVKK